MFEQSFDAGAEGAATVIRCAFREPYTPADEPAYLAFLDRLGARPGPFLALVVLDGGGALSREGERAQALWFKATRTHLDEACRGMAIVRPEVTDHMRAVFGRLWRFPLFFSTDPEAAEAWIAARREALV